MCGHNVPPFCETLTGSERPARCRANNGGNPRRGQRMPRRVRYCSGNSATSAAKTNSGSWSVPTGFTNSHCPSRGFSTISTLLPLRRTSCAPTGKSCSMISGPRIPLVTLNWLDCSAMGSPPTLAELEEERDVFGEQNVLIQDHRPFGDFPPGGTIAAQYLFPLADKQVPLVLHPVAVDDKPVALLHLITARRHDLHVADHVPHA